MRSFLRAAYAALLLLLLALPAPAQPARLLLDSLKTAYPFLNPAADTLHRPAALHRFYQKLARRAAGDNLQLNVVHVGDSHIQDDEFSGRARQELQRRYGNAGLGLVFPYRVARTNGSPAARSAATAGRWQARRVTARPDSLLPVGLSGFALATADSGAAFSVRVPAGFRFDQLTVLREPGPDAFDWLVRDRAGRPLGPPLPGRAAGTTLGLPLDSLADFVELAATRTRRTQTRGLLYGLVLENAQPGLCYHAIGANGAAVRHYARAPRFFAQLPALSPDLIIVSLGTNDAYERGFDPAQFEAELDALVSRLRQSCPAADLLLAAPPDSYRARRYRNPDLLRLRAVLRRYALAHNLAYWDLAAAMGGYGAMRTWRLRGLAQPDLVHFTSSGYALQGLLLFLALQRGLPTSN